MNPKAIGILITNTCANIEARIGRLSSIERQPMNLSAGTNIPSSTVEDILNATLSAQLSNAMERIRTINDADMENYGPERAQDGRSEAGVVDLSAAEYKIIDK